MPSFSSGNMFWVTLFAVFFSQVLYPWDSTEGTSKIRLGSQIKRYGARDVTVQDVCWLVAQYDEIMMKGGYEGTSCLCS